MNKQTIYMIHGTDYKRMAMKIMESAGVAEEIGSAEKRVVLKPNLVAATPPSQGGTTHAELLAGAVEYLQQHGFNNIAIIEGSWVGEITPNAYRTAGYDRVCREYHVPFIDLQKDSYQTYEAAGMQIKVCDQAMKADYIINMPVLKGHCQTLITCALKNAKGMIPNSEKRRFHSLGLHKPIAHLNTVIHPGFILVDNICGDLDFEEGGNPVTMNRVLGFRDPVLCDTFVCESMGYDIDEVPYIGMAEALGVGSTKLDEAEIVMLNQPEKGATGKASSRRTQQLAGYTAPKDACSACYGSLIYALNRLNDYRMLKRGLPPIDIGQGYRGMPGEIGIGACTSCHNHSLKGCPPKAVDIVDFLQEEWIGQR